MLDFVEKNAGEMFMVSVDVVVPLDDGCKVIPNSLRAQVQQILIVVGQESSCILWLEIH